MMPLNNRLSKSLFALALLAFVTFVGVHTVLNSMPSHAAPAEDWLAKAVTRSSTADPREAGWGGPVASWDQVNGRTAIRPALLTSRARFVLPLRRWTEISDPFGVPRGPGKVHGGIDLALSGGLSHSPVYAACNGTVLRADYADDYGLHVVVDCGGDWITISAHFTEVLVALGDSVSAGLTVLGRSGSTGNSTGEHLHFEVRWQGIPVNPETLLDFGRGIQGQ